MAINDDPTTQATPLTATQALQAMRAWLGDESVLLAAGAASARIQARVYLDVLIARVESDAATPAGRVVEVDCCGACPYLVAYVDPRDDDKEDFCGDAVAAGSVGGEDAPTPDWCPLRRGDVTLRLREGEGG